MKLRAEFAKSSRARCRACGQFIEGGTIRWAKENEEDDVRPQYTHLSCLNLGRGTRENIKEDDIIFDGDFTSKQHDAIIEAFHLTAEEKPEDRRMQAIQRHEVAPEKRKDKPEYMVDEEENEDEEEAKEPEAQGNGDEDEEDEDYIEEDAKADEKEEEDEDEYMEDNEIAADVEELKAEASKLQHPNKRRRKNEAKEPDEESGKQMQGSRRRGSRKRSERAGKEQETRQESDEETEEQKGDDKEGVKTSSRDKMKGNKSSEVKSERIRRKYQIMGSDELKEYLRANKQIMSGNQEDMMKRCIDCEMYGALPTCPQCQKGRLIKNEDTGRVECHGYYDEDAGMPARCGFNEDEKKIERRQWREPSEAPPVLFNVHIKGEEGPASLTAEVKKRLDSIVGSQNLSKREMSKELLKYGRQCDLDLPSDDSEAIDAIEEHLDDNNENGKIDYEAAFAEIAREYSKDPEIKGIRRSKSKFEKNEEIAGMLNELATLYGKLGGQDRFRARAEKKAAGAIQSLDFEVRSGKELSSGDTKVEGIGHDTGEMIDEYLETGKIQKLEDARRRVKEQQSK